MTEFSLTLYDAAQTQTIDGVTVFVGEDASGSFGLKAHHARFMTTLNTGLCRFRRHTDDWEYLALPGGVLYFKDNTLSISTRHFLIDRDYERISTLLKREIEQEEESLTATRLSLQKMEQEMLTKLWNLRRHNE